MEFLFNVIIVGFAVGYITELVSSFLASYVSTSLTKKLLTLPLGLLFSWLAGVQGALLFIAPPAAGFVALVIMTLINRPVVLQSGNRRV